MLWRFPIAKGPESFPPFPPGEQFNFPALHDRFATVDKVVLPAFTRWDQKATIAQTSHRRYQLLIILGSLLTTVFGAVQAAWIDARWPAVAVGVLGAATAVVTNQQRRSRPIHTYLSARARAEQLRSLYFRCLSGTDARLTDARGLERAVAAIEFGQSQETAR